MTRRAGIVLAVLAVAALVAPWFAPYDPGRSFRDYLSAPPMTPGVDGSGLYARPLVLVDRLEQRFEPDVTARAPLPWTASADDPPVFLLGADTFGRDVLSRLLSGARISIGLGLVSTVGALLVGGLIGAWAGYRGGWVDELLMRTADLLLVLPVIYVVLVLRAVLPLVLPPATVFLLMAGIFVLVGWPIPARGVRAIVRSERDREFVVAARSLGASNTRILVHHLLPACGGYLVTQAMLLLPAFVLAEATLSYVGLGFPPAVATWGTMLAEASNLAALSRFPWMLAPAVAIFIVVLTANLAVPRRMSPTS
ncbi:MAG: ABC transporter permease [Vicinamibacterales bacterium]